MQKYSSFLFSFVLLVVLLSCSKSTTENNNTNVAEQQTSILLPSWKDGKNKDAIIAFVNQAIDSTSKSFIPVEDRIACFDNDGTLWSEQPLYFQLAFAIDEIKRLAPLHPEWSTKQPYKAILENDIQTALAGGEKSILQLIMATHAGMTTEDFNASVKTWMQTAVHPKTGLHYNQMTFQPMLELLNYLRVNGFKTFIVSGGGVDFMRAWVEEAYGIPPYQVIGSSAKVKYEVKDGIPVLIKLPELNFIDDKEGKPVGIHQYIGKKPVFAAGNSDGDYAMLEWTSSRNGASFCMLVHHTDSLREEAYDHPSAIGQLDKGLKDASAKQWHIIDMKRDWLTIYK